MNDGKVKPEYKVVANVHQGDFVDEVNDLMEEGWMPLGSIQVSVRDTGLRMQNDYLVYTQAMIRE